MRAKILVYALLAFILGTIHVAQAQQPKKVPRIGFLGFTSLSGIAARIEAFQQGLREFGYVEGKNIVVEYRSAEGELDRLPELAAELVRLKVEIIVTSGPSVTRAVKEATTTIPIVMGFDTDPVGNGFVASLARPGGTITGLSVVSPEISGKQRGSSEGDRSQALARGRPRDFNQPGQRTSVKRDGTRGGGV